MKLRCNDIPGLDEWLNERKYFSHDIINELAKEMAHVILRTEIDDVSAREVLKWDSSIEQADQYAKSLLEGATDEHDLMCNCSGLGVFGKFCEYKFSIDRLMFDEGITKQFQSTTEVRFWSHSRWLEFDIHVLQGNRPKMWKAVSSVVVNWVYSKCAFLFTYLLVKYKGWKFDRDARRFMKDKIGHFQTGYHIQSVEEFKLRFPTYMKYDDYEPYIAEIMNCKENVMNVGYPIAIAKSSGTTGKTKPVPVYTDHLNLPSNKKAKISAITTIAAYEKQDVSNLLQCQRVVPAEVYEKITNASDLLLLIALWSMKKKKLEVITCTFVMTLLAFFTLIEEKFDLICNYIELGTLPPDESLCSPLPPDLRLSLESQFPKANPARANELRSLVDVTEHKPFHHISTKIWPHLKCAVCIISSTLKSFESKLHSTYWNPQTPIFPYVYGMSEQHRIAVPRKVNSYELVPLPQSVYYEFIEEDEWNKENPNSLELHQVE
ncbi:unnamed protein product, partial [Didymodactylos carnosus]